VTGKYCQLSIKPFAALLTDVPVASIDVKMGEIFEQTVGRMAGVKPMPYSKLGEQHAFTPLVRP
jgi:hypothetical protein